MIICSFTFITVLLVNLISASTKTLKDVCEVLKIDNPAACIENKVSTLTIPEFQRATNFLESQDDKEENVLLLEELLYYYGLKLSLEINGNNELDAINQWEKIQKTNYLLKLKENKLDDLYLKFGDFDKIKNEEKKQLVANFDNLDIDEQLEISPFNYKLLLSKNVALWDELAKATSDRVNDENDEDNLIIVATELTSNYLTILNKFKKRLSLNEKADYFSILADIEFLILNNFKKSQMFAKNCVEFDDLNQHCLNLIKLNNKILKTKNCSLDEGPFDQLEINKNLNTKWANSFIKMINDKKGKNTFTNLNNNIIEYYSTNEKSKFKTTYKDSPYSGLLNLWKLISNDLTSTNNNKSIGKKKIKVVLHIIKSEKLKNHHDILTNLNEELLNKIWNNKSPYLSLNLIKYLIESKEFQSHKSTLDIKQLAKFLQDKNILHRSENELDVFTISVVSEVKKHLEVQQVQEQNAREQQHQQFFNQHFQQHFQQHAGGHQNFFNGFGGQQFHQQHHQQQQQPQHQQFSKDKDYYKILEVDPNSNNKEIRKSYLNKIKQYHPDKQGTLSEKEEKEMETLVHNINEAYEVLYDDEKRNEYDLYRKGKW